MAGAKIIGLILAGGRAQRMGGREKALLPFGGSDLLSRAIARLKPQCDDLVLNANGEPAHFDAFGLPVVADSIAGYLGPLAGILAGLDWVASHAPEAGALLSVPVDGPFFPKDLASRLRSAAATENVAIACARSGGRRHGVYGLWSPVLRDDLRNALATKGIRKVDDWLARHHVASVEWPTDPIDPFYNINTPDDLAEAERSSRVHPAA